MYIICIHMVYKIVNFGHTPCAKGCQNMKRTKITSITDNKAELFLGKATERQTLSCELITGFHLVKLSKGGSWRYRYKDDSGKIRVATIGRSPGMLASVAAEKARTWNEAEQDPLKEKTKKRQDAKLEAAIASQRTIRNYLENDYARYMDSWSAASAKMTYQRFNNHFGEFLDRDMTTLTRMDVRSWQSWIEAKGLRYPTIQRSYTSLKSLLNHAASNEVIPANPLEKVRLAPPSKSVQDEIINNPKKAERRMLSEDEMRGILDGLECFADDLKVKRARSIKHGKKHLLDLSGLAYPHWFIPFTHLAIHTGLRTGDLYSLTWDELNINFGRLRKLPEKTTGKAVRAGKKPAMVDIPLNDRIKDIMNTWHKQQGSPEAGLVFPSPVTGKRMDKGAHNKPWAAVKAFGGIQEGLNFYAFRHHFISTLVSKGVPLLTVAKLAGHKSTDMIQEHYGHLCKVQAIDALDILASTVEPKKNGGAA